MRSMQHFSAVVAVARELHGSSNRGLTPKLFSVASSRLRAFGLLQTTPLAEPRGNCVWLLESRSQQPMLIRESLATTGSLPML